jgi:general secretion pathway protein D
MRRAFLPRRTACLALIALLAGCSLIDAINNRAQKPIGAELTKTRPNVDTDALKAANKLAPPNDPNRAIMEAPPQPDGGKLDVVAVRGTANTSKGLTAAAEPGTPEDRKPVELQFVDASLRSVIEFLFDQYLKKAYTILPDFKDQKINWIVSGNFNQSETLRMFEVFLDAYGVVLSEKDGVYLVANTLQRATMPDSGSIGQATGIWRLNYVDAKDVVQLARMFINGADRVQIIDPANMLIAYADDSEIRKLDEFIRRVDVPALENRTIMLYAPKYVTPQALVALLQNMPKHLGTTLADQKKPVDAEIIQGMNRVVIVTNGAEMKEAVLEFIKTIDQVSSDHKQVFYYTLQNQKVEDVRATLDTLLKSLFKEGNDVTLVAHAPTNSLLLACTPEQYYEVKKLIDRIDYAVPSVLIDAIIAEVQLTDEMSYGVEWFLRGRLGKLGGNANFSTNDIAAAAATGTLGAFSITNDVVSALNLLSTATHLQVLSRPRVMVKNKMQAKIESSHIIRVQKTTANAADILTSGQSALVDQYEDKKVGISLDVTPIIGDDNNITMHIEMVDSSLGAVDQNGQPTFDERNVKTDLVANSGETLFIGGVMTKQNQVIASAVPGLGDIPVVGNLFQNKDSTRNNSELILMMTPYVIMDKFAARVISDAFSGLGTLENRIEK